MPSSDELTRDEYNEIALHLIFDDLYFWLPPDIGYTVGPLSTEEVDYFLESRTKLLTKARDKLSEYSDLELAVIGEHSKHEGHEVLAEWKGFLAAERRTLHRLKPPPIATP